MGFLNGLMEELIMDTGLGENNMGKVLISIGKAGLLKESGIWVK